MNIKSYLNLRDENEKLKAVIEKYKQLELDVEFLRNQNNNLKKFLKQKTYTKKQVM